MCHFTFLWISLTFDQFGWQTTVLVDLLSLQSWIKCLPFTIIILENRGLQQFPDQCQVQWEQTLLPTSQSYTALIHVYYLCGWHEKVYNTLRT